MINQVRNAYRHLGSSNALSWANVWVAFALQITGSALGSLIDYAERPAEFFTIRLVSLAAFALVIWLGRKILNRFGADRPLPVVTLVTFVVALVISTIVFDAFLVNSQFTDQHDVLRRLITSFPGVMVTQILTSLLVTYAMEFSRGNAMLSETQEELIATRAEASERISNRKIQLIETIRQEITEHLDYLRNSSKNSFTQMQALIDDVVRPLSYSLVYDVEPEPERVYKLPSQKVDWKSVLRNSLYQNPFHWLATPTLIGILTASFLISTFQIPGLLAVLAVLFVFTLFMILGFKMWPSISNRAGVLLRATIFTVFNLLPAWISLLLISQLTDSQFVDVYRLPAWLVFTNVASWTVALVIEVNSMLRSTNMNLKNSISDLTREVVALNSAYRQLQRDISRVLHGPIQRAIHVTLVRLKTNPELHQDESIAADIQTRISEALNTLNAPQENGETLAQSLNNLQSLWRGNVDIKFKIDRHAETIVNSSSATALSVSELVNEATSNAIRHGAASEVRIEVKITEDKRNLKLLVSSNGLPLSADAKYGLGSQLFEDLTLEWSRTSEKGRTVVLALVPLPAR